MATQTVSYEAPTVELLGQVEDLTGSGENWMIGDAGNTKCDPNYTYWSCNFPPYLWACCHFECHLVGYC